MVFLVIFFIENFLSCGMVSELEALWLVPYDYFIEAL